MKWRPISSHAIESDCKVWRISKAQLSPGVYRYALHKHGGEAIAFASDAETLKRIASERKTEL